MIKNNGAVAAGHELTAAAAKNILDLGGNAFDAVIAAGLASAVTEFNLTSLGGGGFLLAHTRDNKNTLFDFFSQTPKSKKIDKENPDFYPIMVDFGDTTQEFHVGMASMAVPGCTAGYFRIHKKLGKLPMSVVAEPAIEYARQGVELNRFQHYCLTLLDPIMNKTEEGRKMFMNDESIIQPGSTVYMRNFADSLEYLVKEGDRAFYEGDFAERLVRDSEEKGGYLTMEDMRDFEVIERVPLDIDYHGNEFITNPLPSSGGILITFALELLEKINLGQYKHGSLEHLNILSDVMALTNEGRSESNGAVEHFLDEANINKYREKLNTRINKWGSTTHVSVVDKEGNAASMTTSNGEGSGYFIPDTGIMINNMLGEEDLNPEGFHLWQEDVRISSMMSPTIVLKDKKPEIVLGSGGSNRIRTAILQVISNVIDFKKHISEAVDVPRIHWERNKFNIEPGFNAGVVEKVKNIKTQDEFVEFSEKNMFFGGVHAVTRDENGNFEGAGDKRRSGVSLVW